MGTQPTCQLGCVLTKGLRVTSTIERYSNTEDVANFLKKPLSWVHHNAGPKGIPRYRVGNQWRYKLSEVAEWVERHAQ
jgi:hypothetical protein